MKCQSRRHQLAPDTDETLADIRRELLKSQGHRNQLAPDTDETLVDIRKVNSNSIAHLIPFIEMDKPCASLAQGSDPSDITNMKCAL